MILTLHPVRQTNYRNRVQHEFFKKLLSTRNLLVLQFGIMGSHRDAWVKRVYL